MHLLTSLSYSPYPIIPTFPILLSLYYSPYPPSLSRLSYLSHPPPILPILSSLFSLPSLSILILSSPPILPSYSPYHILPLLSSLSRKCISSSELYKQIHLNKPSTELNSYYIYYIPLIYIYIYI